MSMYEPVMSIQSDELLEHLRFSVLDPRWLKSSDQHQRGIWSTVMTRIGNSISFEESFLVCQVDDKPNPTLLTIILKIKLGE